MDKETKAYREKHPRCRYCYYSNLISKGLMIGVPEYWICDLKDKMLNDTFFWNWKGCFCKWFKPEEGDE